MLGREIGSILLILGTCVGAAMLALPVVTSHEAYSTTAVILIASWVLMFVGAWLVLQVNLWLPAGTNFISMAKYTLGPVGEIAAWFISLMLLYTLICAYLAGTGDVLLALLSKVNIHIPRSLATIIVAAGLAGIVYRGIGAVDLLNRGLMIFKGVSCLVLIIAIAFHMKTSLLNVGNHQIRGSAWMVMLTSFGFANILPSIRQYLNSDRRRLTRVLLIGSVFPLILYAIWIAVVQGAVPKYGETGLISMIGSPNTTSSLMHNLALITSEPILKTLSVLFVSVCAFTAFLCVSLSLVDFISDGLHRGKKGKDGVLVFSVAFLPPLVVVLFYPGMFTKALAYAGACCVFYLIILPILMYVVGHIRGKDKAAA